MALSLAARFPELIGSKLHHALAQLPCRPMQCQSMIAQLEDAYRAAAFLGLETEAVNKIGSCRYLVEVTALYQAWLLLVIEKLSPAKVKLHMATKAHLKQRLTSEPRALHGLEEWIALSQVQEHIWLTDFNSTQQGEAILVAWQDDEGIWGALTHSHLPELPEKVNQVMEMHTVLRVRGLDNVLPGAKQLSTLHLWQASQLRQE